MAKMFAAAAATRGRRNFSKVHRAHPTTDQFHLVNTPSLHMRWNTTTQHSLAGEYQAVFARAPVKPIHVHRLHVTAGANRSSNRTQWASQDNAIAEHTGLSVGNPSPPSSDPAARVDATAAALRDTFAGIDALIAHNLQRVQRAFRDARVGPHHFAGSTGYGHGDLGRAALDEVGQRGCCVLRIRLMNALAVHR